MIKHILASWMNYLLFNIFPSLFASNHDLSVGGTYFVFFYCFVKYEVGSLNVQLQEMDYTELFRHCYIKMRWEVKVLTFVMNASILCWKTAIFVHTEPTVESFLVVFCPRGFA